VKNLYFFAEKCLFWGCNVEKKPFETKILGNLFRCLLKNHLLCETNVAAGVVLF